MHNYVNLGRAVVHMSCPVRKPALYIHSEYYKGVGHAQYDLGFVSFGTTELPFLTSRWAFFV